MAKKAILLVPLTYNDGSSIPAEVLDEIYEALFVLSGGHTSAGTVRGAYRMQDGTKQTDLLEQVWGAYEEDDKPALRNIGGQVLHQTWPGCNVPGVYRIDYWIDPPTGGVMRYECYG